jgi:predicted amidophosphoribosyltransferase
MFCTNCGKQAQDGAHFCDTCGVPLQAPGAISYQQPMSTTTTTKPKADRRSTKPQDPYQPQIQQIKLQLKQLKLYLKQINTGMSNTRSQYYETAAFVPRGLLRHLDKGWEDMRLLGPQQQKQQLQQQIIQLEQQLLGLQQQQMQWKAQQE